MRALFGVNLPTPAPAGTLQTSHPQDPHGRLDSPHWQQPEQAEPEPTPHQETGGSHLGIHPGGMVICDRPVTEVCPAE